MSIEDLLSALFDEDEDDESLEGDDDLDDELVVYDLDGEEDGEIDLDDLDEEEVDLDDDDIEDYEVGGGVEASCPHCGESMEIFVDPAGGAFQDYVEDCAVCCRPSAVRVTVDKEGVSTVELEPLD